MASPDRRTAVRLYVRAGILAMAAVGFLVATFITPLLGGTRSGMQLPSTWMAIAAAGASLLCAMIATFWWHRDQS